MLAEDSVISSRRTKEQSNPIPEWCETGPVSPIYTQTTVLNGSDYLTYLDSCYTLTGIPKF